MDVQLVQVLWLMEKRQLQEQFQKEILQLKQLFKHQVNKMLHLILVQRK